MTRIRMTWACLLAILAVSAIGAASAQAAPEFFSCNKASGGLYEKGCAQIGTPAGYAREAVKTPATFATVSGLTHIDIFIPGLGIEGETVCTGTKSKEQIISPTQVEGVLTLEKCQSAGRVCTSTQPGQKPGDITTNTLLTTLVASTEAASGIGVHYEAANHGIVDEFTCQGFTVSVTGSITAEYRGTLNVGAESQDVFETNGAGEPTIATGGSRQTLLATLSGEINGTFPVGEKVTATNSPVSPGQGGGSEEAGKVIGAVTSGGAGVEGATVRACPVAGGRCYQAESELNGSYELFGVEPGFYTETVTPSTESPYEPTTTMQFAVGSGAITTENVTLTKVPVGAIVGTIENSAHGPIPSASIEVCETSGERCYGTESAANGSYSFPEVRAGTYIATVSDESPYEEITTAQFTVTAGAPTTENVTLPEEPLGSLTGTISDHESNGIGDAIVDACEVAPGKRCYETETGGNGVYTLSQVHVGTYTVAITPPPQSIYEAATSAQFSVTLGAQSNVSLSLGEEPTGSVEGTVVNDASPAEAVVGASVTACRVTDHRCFSTETGPSGSYDLAKVSAGTYYATANPPSGSHDDAQTSGQFAVAVGAASTQNFTLEGPKPVPPGTTLPGNGSTDVNGVTVPQLYWSSESPISTTACVGGTVTVTVTAQNTQNGKIETTNPVTLTEAPAGSGTFAGKVPAVYPIHGTGTVTINAVCPEPAQSGSTGFTIYIDPSGLVVDGSHNNAPIPGATVTLLASAHLDGPFAAVPNGSTVMSEANRTNPDTTDEEGKFGWDTIPGFYEVTASKPGCGSAATPAFEVPPPVTDLKLVLHCVTRFRIETSKLPAATRGTAYSAQLAASGGTEPYKWGKTAKTKLPKGLKLSKTGLLSGTPSTKLAAGVYPVQVTVKVAGKPKKTAMTTLMLTIS